MISKAFFGLSFIICLGVMAPPLACEATEEVMVKTVAAIDASSAPIAVPKEMRFHFEPVKEGTVITHEFVIKNTGAEPLIIDKVKTSCGCTTADYTRHISPGAEGKVVIKANTRGYAGRKFSKTITAYTNDPKQPQMMFYVSGIIEPLK